MKKQFLKIAIVVLCAFLKFSGAIAQQYTYSFQWGVAGSGNKQFHAPAAIAISPISPYDIYVADAANDRIQQFSSIGGFIRQWGGTGSGNGQFNYPTGIAIDGSGYVYVADQNNNRIQKFNSTGGSPTTIGLGAGSGSGYLHSPIGVAVSSNGNDIYVADSGNDRIQKFTLTSGTYTTYTTWGSIGTTDGYFKYPTGIAINNTTGDLYVADQDNNRIQKRTSSSGAWSSCSTWTSGGNNQFSRPTGVSVDGSGNVYVMDVGNDRMVKFSVSGSTFTFTTELGRIGSSSGLFNYATGCAVNSAGDLYVADQNNNRIQVFTSICTSCQQLSSYSQTDSWGSSGSGNSQFVYPMGVATDASGNIYVVDPQNNRIQKFYNNGSTITYVTQWGSSSPSSGTGNGQFSYPMGIAVDVLGNVYVADYGNNRVQKFSSNGSYITQWGSSGSGASQFNYLWGIAVDASGNVFTSDIVNNRIQKFSTTNGTTYTQTGVWGSSGTGSTNFNSPKGIAVDGLGNVYVADQGNVRISKFDNSGNAISQWSGSGSPGNHAINPTAVAVDGMGNVYIADPTNNKIEKISSSGTSYTFITEWSSGTGNWNDYYQWIAVDRSCNVYATDIFIPGVKVFSGFKARPTITSFTPTSAGICPVVVITGTGFTGATAVSVNGTAASSFTVNSSTQITATFPHNATSGPISVTSGCVAISSSDLTFLSCNATSYAYNNKWTQSGYSNNDMSIDASGNIYLAGPDNYIRKYSSGGTLVWTSGGSGAGAGTFNAPVGIAVNASGTTVYVVDGGVHNLMQHFNASDGSYVGQWSLGTTSDIIPKRLAIDNSDHLYTINLSGNYRIRKYSSSGTPLLNFGYTSYDDPHPGNNCIIPWGIAVDGCYNVFITNSGDYDQSCSAQEVIKYNGLSGDSITKWGGSSGTGSGHFIEPRGITVDMSGNVYVCDTEEGQHGVNSRIQKFDNDGGFMCSFGSQGTSDGHFSNDPLSVVVDMSCNVYVVDGTTRVQVFHPYSGARMAAHAAEEDPATTDVVATDAKVLVHPNPSTGLFNVNFNNAQAGVLIVTDMMGREVHRNTLDGNSSQYQIDLGNQAKGIYNVRVSGTNLSKLINLQ